MMMTLKPKLLVIAGPNGAGKTSITGKILKHEWVTGCVYINPDNIARDKFGDWNSPDAVLRAAKFATAWREQCIANKESLLFESVLSAPDKIEFIQKAKDAGYFIRVFFVGTNHPAINASRIANRVLKCGHDVPIPKIISRYSKSIANCCAVAPIVDRLYVYDNSIENTFPQLLFRASEGKLTKSYTNINDWAVDILHAVES